MRIKTIFIFFLIQPCDGRIRSLLTSSPIPVPTKAPIPTPTMSTMPTAVQTPLPTMIPTLEPSFYIPGTKKEESTPTLAIAVLICITVFIAVLVFIVAQCDSRCETRKRVRAGHRGDLAENDIEDIEMIIDTSIVEKGRVSQSEMQRRVNRASIALSMKKQRQKLREIKSNSNFYPRRKKSISFVDGDGEEDSSDYDSDEQYDEEFAIEGSNEMRGVSRTRDNQDQSKDKVEDKNKGKPKYIPEKKKQENIKVGHRLKDFLSKADLGHYTKEVTDAGYKTEDDLRKGFEKDPSWFTSDLKRCANMKTSEILKLRTLLSQPKEKMNTLSNIAQLVKITTEPTNNESQQMTSRSRDKANKQKQSSPSSLRHNANPIASPSSPSSSVGHEILMPFNPFNFPTKSMKAEPKTNPTSSKPPSGPRNNSPRTARPGEVSPRKQRPAAKQSAKASQSRDRGVGAEVTDSISGMFFAPSK
mmetsp:Transcript_5028/g.6501  ORF Transcript_5028/g.6501 Transcript_5028/m.6501 type:complete len:472 (-) Transcript_5028:36-1451(-)